LACWIVGCQYGVAKQECSETYDDYPYYDIIDFHKKLLSMIFLYNSLYGLHKTKRFKVSEVLVGLLMRGQEVFEMVELCPCTRFRLYAYPIIEIDSEIEPESPPLHLDYFEEMPTCWNLVYSRHCCFLQNHESHQPKVVWIKNQCCCAVQRRLERSERYRLR
jgi:hypothetical protein